MIITTLPKFKRFMLGQIFDESNHSYYEQIQPYVPQIKSHLNYGTLLDIMGELRLVHVQETSTIMMDHKYCLAVVDKLNKLDVNHTFTPPPRSLFQRVPQRIDYYKLDNQRHFKELMAYAKRYNKPHEISLESKKKKSIQKKSNLNAVRSKYFDKAIHSIARGERMISIDVEAFEFAQSKILEIGYTVMDRGIINTTHLIISDNIKYKNKKFVPNNRYNFLFGTSQHVTLKEATTMLRNELNKAPFNLVGHSLKGDIDWIQSMGVHIRTECTPYDTAFISPIVYECAKRNPSLKELCLFCDITPDFLHNAGNDAHYTMQVIQSLCDKPKLP